MVSKFCKYFQIAQYQSIENYKQLILTYNNLDVIQLP